MLSINYFENLNGVVQCSTPFHSLIVSESESIGGAGASCAGKSPALEIVDYTKLIRGCRGRSRLLVSESK